VALQQLEHAAYSTQDEITQQFPDTYLALAMKRPVLLHFLWLPYLYVT